jgi:hypothetical protein
MIFLLTLSLGAMSYLMWYLYMQQLDREGEANLAVTIGLRAIDHIYSTLFFSSLMLVSFGWTISRTFLSDKEKRFAVFSLSSYLLVGIASAGCMDSSATCSSLFVFTYILRTIILLGIVIAMNFSMTQLRTIIMHSPWIQSILFLYARAKQFNYFRVALLLYLILPSIVLLIQVTILSWKTLWFADFLIEFIDVMIAVVIGVSFSPLSESYLSRAFDGSLDAAVIRQSSLDS